MSKEPTNKQTKQPLPNAFDQARQTRKIGGLGKREEPTTSDTVLQQHQQAVNTDNQQAIKPAEEKQSQVQKQEPITHQSAAKKEEEKTKQTIFISVDLATRVKVYVAKHKRDKETITNVWIKALEEYLDKHDTL